jgi:hypothetical protein
VEDKSKERDEGIKFCRICRDYRLEGNQRVGGEGKGEGRGRRGGEEGGRGGGGNGRGISEGEVGNRTKVELVPSVCCVARNASLLLPLCQFLPALSSGP